MLYLYFHSQMLLPELLMFKKKKEPVLDVISERMTLELLNMFNNEEYKFNY